MVIFNRYILNYQRVSGMIHSPSFCVSVASDVWTQADPAAFPCLPASGPGPVAVSDVWGEQLIQTWQVIFCS